MQQSTVNEFIDIPSYPLLTSFKKPRIYIYLSNNANIKEKKEEKRYVRSHAINKIFECLFFLSFVCVSFALHGVLECFLTRRFFNLSQPGLLSLYLHLFHSVYWDTYKKNLVFGCGCQFDLRFTESRPNQTKSNWIYGDIIIMILIYISICLYYYYYYYQHTHVYSYVAAKKNLYLTWHISNFEDFCTSNIYTIYTVTIIIIHSCN